MIPAGLADWAHRNRIPFQAMHELSAMLGLLAPPAANVPPTADEAYAQSRARLDAARAGHWLGRNNVGALQDKTGRVVRYGLANDSAQINEKVKSGDLIGIYRLVVTPAMVGQVVGQFWSLECKRPGWTYTGSPREVAQSNWAALVVANGGRASFTTGEISI